MLSSLPFRPHNTGNCTSRMKKIEKRSSKRLREKIATSPKSQHQDDNNRSPQPKRLSKAKEPSENPSQKTITTFNRFEALSSLLDTDVPNLNKKENHEPKPPLIYLRQVENYALLCSGLEKITQNKFLTRTLRDQISIKTETPDDYREVVKYLKKNNADFHTYQIVADKPLRVVIRHLHPSNEPEDIKNALREKGFIVKNVSPVLSRRQPEGQKREALPLFFVDLDGTAPNSKEVYKIESLLYTRVKVEEPRKRQEILQCHRCQEFKHTKSYCNHAPRCVKCAGYHLTSACTKLREEPPKCALCGGAHPANYKGCTVHLDLQKKTKAGNKNSHPTQTIRAPRTTMAPPPPLQASFASIVAGQSKQNHQELSTATSVGPSQPTNHQEQMTSGPGTSKRQPRGQLPSHVPSPSSFDLTTLMSFLKELKTLLQPIIEILTPLLPLILQILPTNK